MVSGNGARQPFSELPRAVRAGIDDLLGSPVVSAVSQPDGFSPGTADRVVSRDGRRAFVKAASAERNLECVRIHRREVARLAVLPDSLPRTHLIGVVEDDSWIALVLGDVPGRHPDIPWPESDVAATVHALDRIGATSAANLTLPRIDEELVPDFLGWHRLAADGAPVPETTAERLDELIEREAIGLAACRGDRLVHGDVRADNVLIGRDRTAIVLDWPWACRGAPWVDPVLLAANIALFGGDAMPVLVRTQCRYDVPAEHIDGFLAGLAGFFLDGARQPAPTELPALRAFELAQGEATLRVLAHRLSWPEMNSPATQLRVP